MNLITAWRNVPSFAIDDYLDGDTQELPAELTEYLESLKVSIIFDTSLKELAGLGKRCDEVRKKWSSHEDIVIFVQVTEEKLVSRFLTYVDLKWIFENSDLDQNELRALRKFFAVSDRIIFFVSSVMGNLDRPHQKPVCGPAFVKEFKDAFTEHERLWNGSDGSRIREAMRRSQLDFELANPEIRSFRKRLDVLNSAAPNQKADGRIAQLEKEVSDLKIENCLLGFEMEIWKKKTLELIHPEWTAIVLMAVGGMVLAEKIIISNLKSEEKTGSPKHVMLTDKINDRNDGTI